MFYGTNNIPWNIVDDDNITCDNMHFLFIPYHCLLCGCDNHMWACPYVVTLLNLMPIFEWYIYGKGYI